VKIFKLLPHRYEHKALIALAYLARREAEVPMALNKAIYDATGEIMYTPGLQRLVDALVRARLVYHYRRSRRLKIARRGRELIGEVT